MSVRMLQAERLRELAATLRRLEDSLNDRYSRINSALDLADRGYGDTITLRTAADGAAAWALVLDMRADFAETHDPFAAFPLDLLENDAPVLPNDPAGAVEVIGHYFDDLDQAAGQGGDDDRVGYEDLEFAADPANGFPPEVQMAAQYLLANRGLLHALDIAADDDLDPDEEFSAADIDAFLEQNEHLEVVITNFEALDVASDGGDTDGFVSFEDLQAAADDESLPAAVRETAQYLLDNPRVVDLFQDEWFAEGLNRERLANAVLHRLQPNAEEAWELLWPESGLAPEPTVKLFEMLEGDDIDPDFRTELYGHIEEQAGTDTVVYIAECLAAAESSGGGMGALDWLQSGIDVVGFVPLVGDAADGINAGISGIRALADPDRRAEHLADAGLSLAAVVPVLGWGAGAAKLGDTAYDISRAAELANTVANGTRVVDTATTAQRIERYTELIDNLPEDHWLRPVLQGSRFDLEEAANYRHNQLYLERPDGGYVILDSYNPGAEIVSRKYTQIADHPEQAIRSLDELASKYPREATIASTPSVPVELRGQPLRGTQILEVPPQTGPIPQVVLDKADELDIIIRDSNGTILNP